MPYFVTAHTFCASRVWSEIFTFWNFCTVYDYVEETDLSMQGLSESKKKIGSHHIFSEIIELKFGKRMSYILCVLKLF